jgi:hypothetical protein
LNLILQLEFPARDCALKRFLLAVLTLSNLPPFISVRFLVCEQFGGFSSSQKHQIIRFRSNSTIFPSIIVPAISIVLALLNARFTTW